jgi:hypothetical protein
MLFRQIDQKAVFSDHPARMRRHDRSGMAIAAPELTAGWLSPVWSADGPSGRSNAASDDL